jgi:hypothetical protein
MGVHSAENCREFVQLRKGVLKLVFLSNPSIRVLAMSASFRVDGQSKFASIMLLKPTDIIWGSMA